MNSFLLQWVLGALLEAFLPMEIRVKHEPSLFFHIKLIHIMILQKFSDGLGANATLHYEETLPFPSLSPGLFFLLCLEKKEHFSSPYFLLLFFLFFCFLSVFSLSTLLSDFLCPCARQLNIRFYFELDLDVCRFKSNTL